MSRQANVIERQLDHIPIDNIKSWIVNLVLFIQENPSASPEILDEQLALLHNLSEAGATDFTEWQRCPECGERWMTNGLYVSFHFSGYTMEFNCPHCDELLAVKFRPTGAPEVLPF